MKDQRKPRVILYDDDVSVLNVFEKILTMRGHEVLAFSEPVVCPIYEDETETCENLHACSDILITDYKMPRMNGIEVLERQKLRGCKMDVRNKAVISGNPSSEIVNRVRELGACFFGKPVALKELVPWLDECESRIDLSLPVGIKRKELRHSSNETVTYRSDSVKGERQGTLLNFSESGLCLEVEDPVPDDRVLELRRGIDDCCESGFVRWVKETENDTFEVGLKCF